MAMESIIERLLASDEPSIRYMIRTGVLGEDVHSSAIKALQEDICVSPRVKALLADRTAEGVIPGGVYAKWTGAHWVLAALADIGYPSGDATLAPIINQVCACWLSAKHVDSVRIINGRARRCGSQEGNALYSMLKLGFMDERADRLADHLLGWQWPDGGWNCDNRPSASTSSFHETWIPIRALALYAKLRNHDGAREAVARAAEVFLSRHLFRRLRDGRLISSSFTKLFYPPYWHYGILNGLKVMVEAGFIHDARCVEALEILEGKRLQDGGFSAEFAYYDAKRSRVEWGIKSAGQMNEWVTAKALCILVAAGRL